VVGRQVPLMQANGPWALVFPRCPPIEVQCDRKTAGIRRPFSIPPLKSVPFTPVPGFAQNPPLHKKFDRQNGDWSE
jgi:hypothetical protein